MKEKRLIVTRSDESQKKIHDITHPIIKKYADKCDADFHIIEDCKGLHMHYRILQLYDMFKEYDRILSLDTDVLILNRCPIIFDIVPEDYIASIYEDVGSRMDDRRKRIESVQNEFGDIGWRCGYINTGVALFVKKYDFIFKINDESELWMGMGYDDVFLGYRINKMKCQFFELLPIFNFMSMFSESWNNNMKRYEANIIHYAGAGGFVAGRSREDIIKEDLTLFSKYGAI